MKKERLQNTLLSYLLILMCGAVYGQSFVENKGQVLDFNEEAHPEVAFYYSDKSASVYFQKDRLVYNLKEVEEISKTKYEGNIAAYEEALKTQKAEYFRFDMVFQNANLNTSFSTAKQQQGVTHYYLNKRNGIRDVRSFESIVYNDVYSNVDVVFYHSQNGLKYDIVLKNGANINDIRLKFEGADVKIEDKQLKLKVHHITMTEDIPLSFVNGSTADEVDVEYVVHKDGSVGFQLKEDIQYSSLTIDPVLEWGTYFNLASGTDYVYNIANHLDDDGNFFSYGMVQNAANSYPVVNPGVAYTTTANGSADAYFVKFNANRQLVWSTYLGGSGYDEIYDGEIIKTKGNILHLVGERITTGAPFTNGGGFYQAVVARNFWARFNKNTGALEHLTSLSSGYKPSIAISNSGLVAIVNDAYDFSVLPILNRAGAYNQSVNGGTKDMGLLLFNASYAQVWGTFLGSTGSQENFLCAFDSNDNLYFVGETSNNTSLVNLAGAYNKSVVGGGTDIMLGKFTSSGQHIWSTLYGGNGSDARRGQQGHGARILIHPTTNELVLAFNTTSSDLPTVSLAGAYNKTVPTHIDFGGSSGSYWNYAAYLCKFSTAGALNYATYYYTGTGGGDLIENIAFGGCDKFFIGSAGEAAKPLTGSSAGYNLTQATMGGRSGYITMLSSSNFAFEWDGFLNSAVSSEANVAANINHPVFYSMASLYYNNLPLANPGNSAYYNGTSSNSSGAGVGISQFHIGTPPTSSQGDTIAICSGASTTLSVSGGMGAPYNWYNSATSTTSLNTGSSYTVNPSSTTTYYVSGGTGTCGNARKAITVKVSSTTAGTASINNTVICSGSSATLSLVGNSGSVQWESSTDGGSTWSAISGATSATFAVNNITTSASFRAIVTNGLCSGVSNAVSVTVNSQVTPSVAVSGAPTAGICSGGSVILTAVPTNGGAAPTYQWQLNGSNISGATNATYSSSSVSNGDVYTVVMTSSAACASVSVVSASTSAVTVNSQVTPSVAVSGVPTAAICSGGSISLTAVPTNGGAAPTYQWQLNGSNISGATNNTYSTNAFSTGDVFTVMMTSNHTCVTSTTANASTSAIAVSNSVTPSVTIAGVPTSSICSGASVSFTANPTNGGSAPAYQWQVNGTNVVGEVNSTFSSTALNNGDVVSVVMVSNEACLAYSTTSASTSAINVTTEVVPNVTISGAPTDLICANTSIVFTANGANGGNNPAYQWQINGVNVAGETNNTFTSNNLNNGDVVTVVFTSNNACANPSTVSVSATATSVYPSSSLNIMVTTNGNQATLDAGGGFTTYLWSTGQATQSIVVSTSGTYWVTGVDKNGCSSRDTVQVNLQNNSINNFEGASLNLFPNPSNGQFTLAISDYATDNLRIDIYDISGRIIYNQLIKEAQSNMQIPMDLTNVSDGVYMLKLSSSTSSKTLRFTVVK